MNPCEQLPPAAHDVFLCVQQHYRPGRPFQLDLDALDVGLDRIELRDHIDGLVDVGILKSNEHGYVFDERCKHAKAVPSSNIRKKPLAYRLAETVIDQTTMLEPMSLGGNTAALAKNISSWLRQGISEEAVRMMLDEFAQNLRSYCPPGAPHWKAFVAGRQKLLHHVERQFSDAHQWDEDFNQRYIDMFGKKAPKCAGNEFDWDVDENGRRVPVRAAG